jgi:nitrite reductase (NO-forming)
MRTHLIALGLLALLAAGCGGDNGDAPTDETAEPAVGEGAEEVTIDVVMGDIFYQPTGVEVPAGTTLVVNAVNEGAIEHDFEFDGGEGTGMLDPGDTTTAEFGPFEGTTTAYCTVPGHREAGMEFEITVSD